MFDLSGTWTVTDAEGEHAAPFAAPGDMHSALLAAGLIPDPYHGRNEYGVRWVADRDWTISRSFEHSGEGPATLVVDVLDTIAEIHVNGTHLATSRSAFEPFARRIDRALVPGENRLAITFRSATREASARAADQPFPVPYHAGNCPIPHGNMLRKPQCDFGWDWGIALAPAGVYGTIALAGPEGAILDVRIEQAHRPGAVTVRVTVTVTGHAGGTLPWRVALCGAEARGEASSDDDLAIFETRLAIADPALWWPAGLGAQPIHPLEIEAGALRRTMPLALRAIRLVSEPDAAGRSFAIHVNGRAVFARGANWIPADALPGRITEEKTRALLQSAADAQMNMIRVWGGGRYEPASFYEACDSLGLLVWQDFMFACHLYPCDDPFLDDVAQEVRVQARRIGHHVALWCGDNELLGALNWFEESRLNRDRYLVAYDRLNRTIEQTLKATLAAPIWWPSSPSPGPMSFGDAWHDDTSGDMHFWSVWHEGRDFEHYRDVKPRFCSEFGFHSYPSLPVIRSFADEPDLNIASPVMEAHQKNPGGNARIAETMFRYFRFPADFASFVWLSQVQQGMAIKTAVDAWRSLKPHCMGTLYWQLNDSWPVASWSSLDHGGSWKLLHHMARRFFAPVTVIVIPEAGGFRATAINDTADPVTATCLFHAVSLAGAIRPLTSAEATVGTEEAAPLAFLDLPLAPDEVLAFQWLAGDRAGHDVVLPARPKALDLHPPGLTLTSFPDEGVLRARVTAEALALWVTLEADRPGHFSDNAVAVYPGRDAEISFSPADGDPTGVTLSVRDLHSNFAPGSPR
jgi:beta-mannosidase